MGKNGFLDRINQQKEYEMECQRRYLVQLHKDLMRIAANRRFGFGAKRGQELVDEFEKTLLWYADLTIEDAKSDKCLVYMKEKVDEQLRAICGEDFVPWEERYI